MYRFRRRKAAVKMHTLLDLRGDIPTIIRITDGKVHDVNLLDEIMPEAGAFYLMDRGYFDFERLFVLKLSAAFFVVRAKSNVLLQRRYSHSVDKSTGVRSGRRWRFLQLSGALSYCLYLVRHSVGGGYEYLLKHLGISMVLCRSVWRRNDARRCNAGSVLLSRKYLEEPCLSLKDRFTEAEAIKPRDEFSFPW